MLLSAVTALLLTVSIYDLNLRRVDVSALTPQNLSCTVVYGDVFVGRVKSRPAMRNVDINTEDIVDTSREWLVKAPSENIAWQQEVNKVTGRQGDLQPNHAGTEGVSVDAEGYSWTQTDEEIEMTVSLSEVIPNGEALNKKLIKVAFLANKVTVKYNSGVVVDVGLYSRLDVDGCTWTLDGENLIVTGEKLSEEIWPRLQLSS